MIECETEINKKLRIELLNKDLEISELRRSIERLHCITLDAINATELLVSPTKQYSIHRENISPSTDISMNLFDRYNDNVNYDDDGDDDDDENTNCHRQQISSTRYLQDTTDANNDNRDNIIFHKSMEVAQLQQQLFNIHTEYAKNLSEFYNDKSFKESYINELEHRQAQLCQHVQNLERSNMELKVYITEINKESKRKEQAITSLMDELQSEREYNGHDDRSYDDDDHSDDDDDDHSDDDDDNDDNGDDSDAVMNLDVDDRLVSIGPNDSMVEHLVWFNDLNPEDKEGDSGTISIDYSREDEEEEEEEEEEDEEEEEVVMVVEESGDAGRDGDMRVIIHHHDVSDHVNDILFGKNSCDDGSTDANDYLPHAFVESEVYIDGGADRQVSIVDSGADSGVDREVSIVDGGADREVRIDNSCADREVSIDDSCADRVVSIDDSCADREVSIDDSCADREVSIDDNGSDREVRIDDSGVDREVSIDDSGVDREVSIHDSFADREVSIDNSIANREVSIDDSFANREVSIDDSGADREVRIDDSGVDREVSIDDSGANREVSIDDSGSDREVSIDDGGADREVRIDDSCADREVRIDDSCADREVSIDDSGSDREVSIDDSGADREVSIDDIGASHSSALINGIISATFIAANDNSTIDGNISIYDSTIDSSVSMVGTVLYNDDDALHTQVQQQQQQQQQKLDEDINMLEKGGSIINILPSSEAIVEEALKQQIDILTCDLQCTRRKVYELTETIAALERERSSLSFEHSDMLLFFIVLHLIMYFASVERFDVEDFIAICLYYVHVVIDKLQYLLPMGKKATLHFVFKQ